MKRYFLILIPVLILSLLWSCISIRTKHPLASENTVEDIYLCKKIDESGELLEPLEIQSEFTSEDNCVICFIGLKNIYEKIALRWKWYSPEAKMVRDTGNIIVNQDRKFLEAVTAYDKFKIIHEDNIEGQWIVAIFIDDKFIGRETFQIKKK
jgi:hypothetical protein